MLTRRSSTKSNLYDRHVWAPKSPTYDVSIDVSLPLLHRLQFLDSLLLKGACCLCRAWTVPIWYCIFTWRRACAVHILSRSLSALYCAYILHGYPSYSGCTHSCEVLLMSISDRADTEILSSVLKVCRSRLPQPGSSTSFSR